MTHAMLQKFTLINFPHNITYSYSGTIYILWTPQLVFKFGWEGKLLQKLYLNEYFNTEQG